MPDVQHPPHRKGFPSLTGLRALAAGVVWLNHVGYLLGATAVAGALDTVQPVSLVGVFCFFVLSGFLLSQPGSLRGGVGSFYRRRGARIVPVYWLALLLTIAYLAVRSQGVGTGEVVSNVLLVQAWSPDGQDASIVLPAWSLSVELLFYVLLPLVLPRVGSVFARHPRGSLAVLVVAAVVGDVALQTGVVADTFPPAYLPIFFLGVHAQVTRLGVLPLRPAAVLAVVLAASYLLVPSYVLPSLGAMLLVASLAGRDAAGSPTVLSGPRVRAFGEWSYGFFLLHTLVISAIAAVLPAQPESLVVGLGSAAISFVGAWVLSAVVYSVVEEPLRLALTPRRPQRPESPEAPQRTR